MKNVVNHVDKKYGSFTVWSQWIDNRKKQYRLMGFCKCDCGKEKIVRISHLVTGAIVSCGCVATKKIKQLNLSHGRSKQSIHNIWKGIRQRCLNPNSTSYVHYGARGITICDRWKESFENFIADMGERPSKDYSVDRIDNNGNYEPGNCRWATRIQQANNRRKRKQYKTHANAKVIVCFGIPKVVSEWAKLYKIHPSTITKRLNRGWSIEDSITIPNQR